MIIFSCLCMKNSLIEIERDRLELRFSIFRLYLEQVFKI
jgi:hypothetical protein